MRCHHCGLVDLPHDAKSHDSRFWAMFQGDLRCFSTQYLFDNLPSEPDSMGTVQETNQLQNTHSIQQQSRSAAMKVKRTAYRCGEEKTERKPTCGQK